MTSARTGGSEKEAALPDLDSVGVSLANYEESRVLCRATFLLPCHAALFRDHFPGQPLMPAIGLLYLCDWMIRRWRGGNVRIATLRRVRFTEPVRPDVRLEIELTWRGSQRLSMLARSESGEHGSGELCILAIPRQEAENS